MEKIATDTYSFERLRTAGCIYKGYAEKYLRQDKKVTLVGAAFDAEMRNLSDRVIEGT